MNMLSEWRGHTTSCFDLWIAARAHREEADGCSNQQGDFQWKTPFGAWKVCKPRPGEQDTHAKVSQVFSLLKTESSVSTRVPELFTISGAAPVEVSTRWVKCSVGEGIGQGQVLASVTPLPSLRTQPCVPRTSACRQHLVHKKAPISPRTQHRCAQLVWYWREQAPQGRVLGEEAQIHWEECKNKVWY